MSQPRRKRRRRRKPSTGEGAQKPRQEGPQVREQASALDGSRAGSSRSRNRRRRRRGGGAGIPSPKSSEDLVRALPRERPAQLTAPPDGQSLDKIIGELQSDFGVPAYPQEYRITIKVAEEKPAGAAQPAPPKTAPAPEGAPKREKAPAAPRVGPDGSEETPAAERPAKRRRGRRRRGRGKSSGPGGTGGSSSPGAPPPPPPPA
ncbi:MAG TPA: hypothetical protein VHN37_00325 [Actinomycetota bacterium]|nr:hypothetical protein [Actinomycetota bacterium]